MPRYGSNRLADNFILIHNKRAVGLGIIEFNKDKSQALVCYFWYDDDGDLAMGHRCWQDITVKPKGPAIFRKSVTYYINDFVQPK